MSPSQVLAVRKLLGLTQEQFARLFDVHPMTVSKWERGELHPTAYQIGLMESFKRTAEAKSAAVQEELKKLLVTAGVIAALAYLLSR
jgi:DNA-binding transcriptional regulator YiaG